MGEAGGETPMAFFCGYFKKLNCYNLLFFPIE